MADVTGLLTFTLLALSVHALAALRGFYYINQRKTWTEAQSYCREKYDDLVSVENADDWARVRTMIHISGQASVWIGLYDDATSWTWTMNSAYFYEQDSGRWLELNTESEEYCAAIQDGTLFDYDCGESFPFVCYDNPSNSYIRLNSSRSWNDARLFCMQSYTELACIRNMEEFNKTMSAVDQYLTYWVGLFRQSWTWSDKSRSNFKAWAAGEPNEGDQNCVVASFHNWYDEICDVELPFICSGDRRRVLKVTLKTDGSVNLNDPLVQEAVAKQMARGLREQGIRQEIRLRWRKQPHGDVFKKTEL